MKIQRFNVHADLPLINDWLANRELPSVTRHDLPEMGYVMWDNGKGVAAIFMRRCEGNVGIVDSLITNPKIQSQVRDFALDALINHIVEQSKQHKVKILLGYTKDENTLMRTLRLGWTQSPHTIVVMDLSKPSGVK